MKIAAIFIGMFFTVFLSAADDKTKETPIPQIEKEISQAEKDFEIAKKMFLPWYGGPLLTGSGNIVPVGYLNIYSTVQVTDYYAAYDSHRHTTSIDDIITVNPLIILSYGFFKRFEGDLYLQGIYQQQGSAAAGNICDTAIKLNLALLYEAPYAPAMKISVKQYFPTGKYRNLNPGKRGMDITGAGTYRTELGLNISKVVWWVLTHPMQFRLALNYGFPHKATVTNFNCYGGGYGTNGKAHPGNYFSGSIGYEFSFTQKFVFALDIVYEYHNKVTFSGNPGLTSDGDIATVGAPSYDVFSLAPALEYNFSPDVALIGGVWFTVCGRNTLDFVAGILAFSYGF